MDLYSKFLEESRGFQLVSSASWPCTRTCTVFFLPALHPSPSYVVNIQYRTNFEAEALPSSPGAAPPVQCLKMAAISEAAVSSPDICQNHPVGEHTID
eukprot:scaffold149892_cov28-Prasinocladus_malaysianus.AAC.1